jgi:two-component system OmpR family response regulator/two-component system alkaline phosphatase synthesis response regulator PhoP
MPRILLIEDEPDIALGLSMDLEAEGHTVDTVADGLTASRQGRETRYDLILLDVMLPKRDGFEVLRDLRRAGVQTPILMLTARAQEAEKVMGLELGADDYVTKPFSPRELRARVKALLRRAPSSSIAIMRFGDCELDPSKPELRRNGEAVEMTALEFRILEALLQNAGRVLTRDRLIELVWGSDTNVTDRVIDTHVVKLRRKVEADPASPRIIVSVRGLGYRLDMNTP